MSPYCARETTGGTSAVPRTIVGEGVTVGEAATVADGLAVGVGLELAGATQAPTASDATIRKADVLIGVNVRAPGNSRRLMSASERAFVDVRRESDELCPT